VSYEVYTTRKVEKAIARLPKETYDWMNDAIDALADDPRPSGCKKLSGREGYSIRVGQDYRVIYQVDDAARRVNVVKVSHRGDVYRR
jgi:mRNA interferase RelE/StbE